MTITLDHVPGVAAPWYVVLRKPPVKHGWAIVVHESEVLAKCRTHKAAIKFINRWLSQQGSL